MKKSLMSLLVMLLFAPTGFCASPIISAAKPTVSHAKAVVIPSQLLDLLAKVEGDRQAGAEADAAIVVAQTTLTAATKAKAAAVTALKDDVAAFYAAWNAIYGPTPVPPTPPEPVPPPVPPVPPVPPPPVPQKVQVVVIEETDESTAAFSAVRNSKAIRQWAEAGGHAIFFLDKDSAAKGGVTWRTWADRAVGKTLPYMFISPHEGGEPLKECAAPQTVSAFLDLLKIYGGVGASRPAETAPVPAK